MKWLSKFKKKYEEMYSTEYHFLYLDELPDKVCHKTIYIIGEIKRPWLIAFNCPCGCKDVVQLNLLKEAEPCWRFKIDMKKKISISPSIWKTTGCKSHFFVRNSKINWVLSRQYY